MTPPDIFRELSKLAHRLGIVVRFEPFDARVIEGRGGLCRLRGVPTVMADAGLPLLDKIGVLTEALATFNLEVLYVPPLIRARISRRTRALTPR